MDLSGIRARVVHRLYASLAITILVTIALTTTITTTPHASAAEEPPVLESNTDNQLGLTFSPDGQTAFWVAWDGKWGSSAKSRQVIYM